MVGEYAADGHLFQLLKQHHRLEEEQVRKYARETAEGISAIHNRGYIHRDIKPENILLQFVSVVVMVGTGQDRRFRMGYRILRILVEQLQ
jgi:eukaryotic-like serine/threonine-protein kinase